MGATVRSVVGFRRQPVSSRTVTLTQPHLFFLTSVIDSRTLDALPNRAQGRLL